MLWSVVRWFTQIGDDPALAQAQAAQLHRQIPLLYGLLLINSSAIAYTHSGKAPVELTLSIPLMLFGITAVRLVQWVRIKPDPSPVEARRRLRLIASLSGVVALAYIAWSLTLAHYGGPFEQAHVALYISTTVIGCIFCLVHLPQAAVIVSVSVIPAFFIGYVDHQRVAFAPIILNVLLVLAVLLRVLFITFEGFRRNVETRAELCHLNDENRRIALTDGLTMLANRRSFYDDLSALASTPERVDYAVVGILDLDRFKPVNDTFGHHVGDLLLAEIAQRLRSTGGLNAQLYRLGGDEFGLITYLPEEPSIRLAERMCQAVAAPCYVDGRPISVGASIGLASFNEADITGDTLAERADYALYQAKRNNPGSPVLFSRDLEQEIRAEQAMEIELRSESFERELDVHVQPIVDSSTGHVIGGEVLARWTNARLGSVEPDRFITVAERSCLIHRITLAVLDRALHILTELPAPMCLSVNLSACDLASPKTIEAMLAAVRRSRVCPGRLWIEVTETAVMRDIEGAIEALRVLRSLGIKVALDDFGTGYSSLSNLHRLPLDRVKIDRSFAADLADRQSSSIARAVVSLCQTLALTCIAEGVETPEQAKILRDLGCEFLQGYLFSRPLPADRFIETVVRSELARRAA